MNSIIKNNAKKLKSWSKVVNGEVVIIKPKDDFQFQVAITVVENAIKNGQMCEKKFMEYLRKEQ